MDLKSLARAYTQLSIQTLGGVAQNGDTDAARVSACRELLDRGWGKANQPVTGEDGGPIEFTIRTIVEAMKKP